MSQEKIAEIVDEAKKPGVFNILDAIKDRGLPKDVVSIIVDDVTAYKAAKVKEQIDEIINSSEETIDQDKLTELQGELDSLKTELNANRFLFHISGISEGKRDELAKKAYEAFPREFEEQKNPFTGEITKKEIDSEERDEYMTRMLWAASIEKIVAPDGSEQTGIDESFVQELRGSLSIPATAAIMQGIERLRIATAVFVMSVDEDFLAKP